MEVVLTTDEDAMDMRTVRTVLTNLSVVRAGIALFYLLTDEIQLVSPSSAASNRVVTSKFQIFDLWNDSRRGNRTLGGCHVSNRLQNCLQRFPFVKNMAA